MSLPSRCPFPSVVVRTLTLVYWKQTCFPGCSSCPLHPNDLPTVHLSPFRPRPHASQGPAAHLPKVSPWPWESFPKHLDPECFRVHHVSALPSLASIACLHPSVCDHHPCRAGTPSRRQESQQRRAGCTPNRSLWRVVHKHIVSASSKH